MMLLSPSLQKNAARLAVAIPLLLLFYWVMRWNVNMPFFDQWAIYDAVIGKDHVTLADLWAQHNEHRSFFPELLWWGLSLLSGWDVRWDAICGVIFGIGSFVMLLYQIRKEEKAQGHSFPWLSLPLVSLLFFSMSQWDAWLTGMESSLTLQIMAVLAGFSLLLFWAETLHPAYFAAALICGIVASYSFASGLLYWPVSFLPVIAVKPRFAVLWIASALIVIAIYFSDYAWPAYSADVVTHAVHTVLYAIVFIGVPFDPANIGDAFLYGMAGIIGFSAMLYLHRMRAGYVVTHFFFLVNIYILLTALMVGAGRSGFGLAAAFESRYIPFSTLFWISLIVLLLSQTYRRYPAMWSYILACLLVIAANVYIKSLPAAEHRAALLRQGREYFTTHAPAQWSDEELKFFFPPAPQQLRIYMTRAYQKRQSIFRERP